MLVYLARDTAIVQKISMKFNNSSEPSPTTSVNYEPTQSESKPFGQKEKEVNRLENAGMTMNKAFSSKFGKPPKQIDRVIHS